MYLQLFPFSSNVYSIFHILLWCLDMIMNITTILPLENFFAAEHICIIAQKIFIIFYLERRIHKRDAVMHVLLIMLRKISMHLLCAFVSFYRWYVTWFRCNLNPKSKLAIKARVNSSLLIYTSFNRTYKLNLSFHK